MKNDRFSKIIILLFIIFLIFSCDKNKKANINCDNIYFIEYGVLFKIDNNMNLQIVGFFHPAAPTVARDPYGFFWARVDNNHFAAINPENGKMIADIKLPFRPYNHIITPDGKAYITHNTLTKDRFTISIVDTKKKKFVGEIKGIHGLRTSIVYCCKKVYLATMGFGSDKYLYLYRIYERHRKVEEVLKESIKNHVLLLASFNNKVFIFGSKPLSSNLNSINLYILENSTNSPAKMKLKIDRSISRITGKPFSKNGKIYIPIVLINGNSLIVTMNTKDYSIADEYPLEGTVYKIIDIKNGLLFYLDNPLEVGKRGVSLICYDTIGEKEVKRVSLLNFLQSKLQNIKKGG